MSKVILELANEVFIVSEDTARRVQAALPPDRTVTIVPIVEPERHPLNLMLEQRQAPPSKFDKFRQATMPLTGREQQQAQRIAEKMSKSVKKAA